MADETLPKMREETKTKHAKEKNIYGTKIFLVDGTEIDDDEILLQFQSEVLIIANEEWDAGKRSPSVQLESPTASELTVPNTPTSTIGSNISDLESFQIPHNKFPSVLISKLNDGGLISTSDVNTIIRTVGDELIHHKKVPTRSIYRLIAQELCERFPQLYDRDDDTKELVGTGYYTVLKKIEERVHYLQRPNKTASRSSCSNDASARKKSKIIKNQSAGCKEWQPSYDNNEDEEIAYQTKKTWLKSNAYVKERDASKVDLFMKDTYGCQRTFLNGIPAPTLTSIANEWPILLEEKYMISHFDRLCGLDSSLCVDSFDNRVSAIHDQLSNLLSKKQVSLLQKSNENTEKNITNVLLLLSMYFKEDLSCVYEKYKEPLTKSEIVSRVKIAAPSIRVSGIDNIAYLVVENVIVSEVESTSKSALQLLFAAYFNFNMTNPIECQNTLEFLQRFVFKINPTDGSKVRKERTLSKVLPLMAKSKSN